MATWDLLVRGGTLIDPAQSISGKRDVAFSGGRIAAVGESLAGDAVDEVKAPRRFRTRHVIRDGRRLSAARADEL